MANTLQRGSLRAVFLAAALVAACIGEQRFPVCKTNADCTARKGGDEAPVCFNLKCVECRYDIDCKPGDACTSGNTCARIESTTPEKEGTKDEPKPAPKPAPEPKEDGGGEPGGPSTWSECAEHCKDKACLQKCSERFEK